MSSLLLIAVALGLRVLAGAARAGGPAMPWVLLGSLYASGAAWLFAGAAGALAPLWLAVVLGAVAAPWERIVAPTIVRFVNDVAVIAAAAMLSVPTLRWPWAIACMALVAGGGAFVDLAMARLWRPLRIALATAPPAMIVGAAIATVPYRHQVGAWIDQLPHLGVVPVQAGTRVELSTGSVAWFDAPQQSGPVAGAAFFHGAHPDGSGQKAACVLRRALVAAGYAVLSVDHPAHGASPGPDEINDPESWDPYPSEEAALATLRQMLGVEKTIVVGHSMGSGSVLRLIGRDVDLRHAVLFGAGLSMGDNRVGYWYQRFHQDRGLQQEIDWDTYKQIDQRYYDIQSLLETLDADHTPVLFVRFENEWPNIAATREELRRRLPGENEPWDLIGSDHYFNSIKRGGIVVADTRVIRRVTERLRLLARQIQTPPVGRGLAPDETRHHRSAVAGRSTSP